MNGRDLYLHVSRWVAQASKECRKRI
jgi:hypothetical protein